MMIKLHPLTLALRGLVLLLTVSMASCQSMSPPVRRSDATRPARISFLTVPDGASVSVNGRQLVGTTPVEYEAVEPGLSVIELHLEGYQPVRLQRYWEAGAAERIDVALVPLATPAPEPTAPPTPSSVVTISAVIAEPSTPLPTRTPVPTRSPTTAASRKAKVTFLSKPPGAAVTVNGRRLAGSTPLRQIELPAGDATIVFERQSYEPVTVKRTWAGGSEDTVTADLQTLPARVSFVSTPAGATVKVNGVVIEGTTPIEAALVPAGASDVTFELENFVPFTSKQKWKPHGESRVEATLAPLDARVRFESDPPGATVVVNGTELDAKTPLGPIPMPPQLARIEFRLEGHDGVVVEREWEPNASDDILAKLTPKPGRVRFESPAPWDSMTIDGATVVTRPGGWLPLSAGSHEVLAVRGSLAAETDFEVPPGGDTVVSLDWEKKRPNPTGFVELPAIEAKLGSKQLAGRSPARTVDVPAFWIARREVTVDQYRRCVEAQACPPPGTEPGCNWTAPDRSAHPINCVSATDAQAYASWLGESEGLPYRLPTGNEWERAAHAEGTTYPWGDDQPGARCNICDKSCALEEFRDESANDGWPQTAPVGAMAYCVSHEGVLDLIGNVAEWCRIDGQEDRYQARGGSWAQNGIFLDPALGVNRPATDRDPTVGFRLVVSLDAATESTVEAAAEPTATSRDQEGPTPTPDGNKTANERTPPVEIEPAGSTTK